MIMIGPIVHGRGYYTRRGGRGSRPIEKSSHLDLSTGDGTVKKDL